MERGKKLKRWHKGCGGVIKDKKCLKCGKVWGRVKWYLASDIEEKSDRFDPDDYRKRIREGRDLPW